MRYFNRYLYLLLIVGILTEKTFCRPPLQNMEESQGDEAEYEEEDAVADESAEENLEPRIGLEDSDTDEQEGNDQEKPPVNDLDAAKQQMERRNDDTEKTRHNMNKNTEGYANEKRKTNDKLQSSAEQHDISQFLSKGFVEDEKKISRRVDTNKVFNNHKLPINKLTLKSEPTSNEDSDVLFERSLKSSQDRLNTFADARSQYHFSKQDSDSVHESDSDINKYKVNLERGRRDARDVKETIQSLSATGTNVAENAATDSAAAAAYAADATASVEADSTEDEETAIKKHVKKLSAQELNELMNSLSEDKRQLLIKIMGNEDEYNVDINKREITKKDGVASDVNSLVENGQPDVCKLQESGAISEVSSMTEAPDVASKKLENSQSSMDVLPVTPKTTDTSNETSFSSLFTVKKVEIPNSMETSNLADPKSNPAPELKLNSKRETDVDQLSNVEGSFDEDDDKLLNVDRLLNECGNFDEEEKGMSEFDDDPSETEFYNKIGNALKREASDKSDDGKDAVMSLEDSFPNDNACDDNDSEMAPLVRVKRKNLESSQNKRSVEMASDSKVAYCPYRAENEDEDNDEGSEFDDDGFYDRTSNLAKSVVKDSDASNSDDSAPKNFDDNSVQLQLTGTDDQTNLVNPDKSDVAKIGSDTDSVLSGGEGINENLMFNSGLRNKRTFAESKDSSAGREVAVDDPVEGYGRPVRSTILDEEIAVTQDGPHNFEGEPGRYKRIRRVKLPESPETENL